MPTIIPSSAPSLHFGVPVEASEVSISPQSDDYSLKGRVGKTIASEEKRLIAEVLNRVNWNRRKAADILQISYRSLLYKIKDYNLNSTK
jgi:transcriptional regulator with PAS, ATPase and Fis domain